MDNTIYISNKNDMSERWAIFEDNGISGWLYLTSPQDKKPTADCWIYNRINAPLPSEISKYRPGPPPASSEYANKSALFPKPNEADIEFRWSQDGNAVALLIEHIPLGYIVSDEKRGFSLNLTKQGPWGNVFNQDKYNAIFS